MAAPGNPTASASHSYGSTTMAPRLTAGRPRTLPPGVTFPPTPQFELTSSPWTPESHLESLQQRAAEASASAADSSFFVTPGGPPLTRGDSSSSNATVSDDGNQQAFPLSSPALILDDDEDEEELHSITNLGLRLRATGITAELDAPFSDPPHAKKPAVVSQVQADGGARGGPTTQPGTSTSKASTVSDATQIPRVGVAVFVLNTHGHVLIGKRKGSHGDNTIALPGGHLDLHESFEECAIRETFEETGIELDLSSHPIEPSLSTMTESSSVVTTRSRARTYPHSDDADFPLGVLRALQVDIDADTARAATAQQPPQKSSWHGVKFVTAVNAPAMRDRPEDVPKHYVTIFMKARGKVPEGGTEVEAQEPEKCAGWVWVPWSYLVEAARTQRSVELLETTARADGRALPTSTATLMQAQRVADLLQAARSAEFGGASRGASRGKGGRGSLLGAAPGVGGAANTTPKRASINLASPPPPAPFSLSAESGSMPFGFSTSPGDGLMSPSTSTFGTSQNSSSMGHMASASAAADADDTDADEEALWRAADELGDGASLFEPLAKMLNENEGLVL
ncbi:hypothetical protein CF326_g398 [Tilletia indica]|nr:hypothetical protein CF326_g398 [Tilletia indica]